MQQLFRLLNFLNNKTKIIINNNNNNNNNNNRKSCCILLVAYIVVLVMHGHTNIKFKCYIFFDFVIQCSLTTNKMLLLVE